MTDRKDLKAQALLERVTALTTQYENVNADLRVEVTVLTSSNKELQDEVVRLQTQIEELNDIVSKNTEGLPSTDTN